MSDADRQYGVQPPDPLGRGWLRSPADPEPTPEEHGELCRAATAFLDAFLAEHRPGREELVAYFRGDFFGDRSESLVVDVRCFEDAPELVGRLARLVREFLSQERFRAWRVVLPLGDATEGGSLAIYPDAIVTDRELAPDEVDAVVAKLVLRALAREEGRRAAARARVERVAPRLAEARRALLAGDASARVVGAEQEPDDDERVLVWVLHRVVADGEGLAGVQVEPDGSYGELWAVGEDGALRPDEGRRRAGDVLLALWEIECREDQVLRLERGDEVLELEY